MRKLTYFIACSIDGFIGDPSGDAAMFHRFADEEFLAYLTAEYPETLATHGRRALGVDHLENRRFDTVVQGRASYDLAFKEGIASPYAHLRQYVASRTLVQSPDPHVEVISTDLLARVRALKSEGGEAGIYLCGGSRLAGELADEIDEIVVKTYPVVLHTGMPMFGSDFRITEFALDELRAFSNGVLVRTYRRK
ncbi:dihydrofolate reductase family protein [Streptomyces sp. NPDC021356]|uniref:dihydrofolate reductase family protein n=1 Tax=Streptomyces sp. NPDC021356 TaxID=3154900 RepID=UPI0033FC4487